jgi:hypothetical protein
MITISSLSHSAKSADSYAYNKETLHIRFRTVKGEVAKVSLWIGDPYQWEEGGLDGGNLGGSDAHGWSGGNEVHMEKEGQSESYDHWFAAFTPCKRRSRYGFILYGNNGEKLLFGERRCVDISKPPVAETELSNLSNFFASLISIQVMYFLRQNGLKKQYGIRSFLNDFAMAIHRYRQKTYNRGERLQIQKTLWAVICRALLTNLIICKILALTVYTFVPYLRLTLAINMIP